MSFEISVEIFSRMKKLFCIKHFVHLDLSVRFEKKQKNINDSISFSKFDLCFAKELREGRIPNSISYPLATIKREKLLHPNFVDRA